MLIINLIKKKKNKIISHKNCEINAQLLFNSNLFNLIFEKNADIQNFYLFACIILEKHAKNLSEMMNSLVMLTKKFAVVINRFFNSNSL